MDTVVSGDGTRIAFDRDGDGPALILVAGALTPRSAFAPLAALLAPHFTVYAVDRRGRGDSGDTQPYAVEREVDDLRAVIEAAGGPVSLFGHSSGAILALETAAAEPSAVRSMVLYEPPMVALPTGFTDQLFEFARTERRDEALALWMRTTAGMPPEQIVEASTQPWWSALRSIAPTTPYDASLAELYPPNAPLPARKWADLTAPVLVLDGEISAAPMREAAARLAQALPIASRKTLPGEGHGAPADVIAPILIEWAGR